jgi:glucosamine-6-phosphate deaminase
VSLETIIVADTNELAVRAADELRDELLRKPDLSLLAATGNTPMGCYAQLGVLQKSGAINSSKLRVAQLDEYLGIADHDPRSLYGWLFSSLLEPLKVVPERTIRFYGDTKDPERDCQNFEAQVRDWGGIDLSLLGLGPNGHLGFNEPPSTPDAPTRAVKLTPASLLSNAGYWSGLEVPKTALTAGMDLILASKRVILLVSGSHKRQILHRTLREAPTPEVPASWLQHANLTLIADRAAWGEG